MYLLAYILSYCLWAVWHYTRSYVLLSEYISPFIGETVVKALVWIGPLSLLRKQDEKWLISPKEMLSGPFPWYATFVGLCMIVAFLHKVHIDWVGIDSWGIFQPMWFYLSLSAAIVEEIAFRGFLFNRQSVRCPVIFAAVFNGILFAVFHYPEFIWGQNLMALVGVRFWIIVVMGMLFSLAFAKWKHLGMTILLHFVWNLLCYWFALA